MNDCPTSEIYISLPNHKSLVLKQNLIIQTKSINISNLTAEKMTSRRPVILVQAMGANSKRENFQVSQKEEVKIKEEFH